MKKATKIPEFKSLDEEFEFWSAHDVSGLMDKGEEVQIDFSEARRKRDARKGKPSVIRRSDSSPSN